MKLKRKPTKPKRKTGIEDYLGSVDIDVIVDFVGRFENLYNGKSLENIEDSIRTDIARRFELYFKTSGLSIDSYTSILIKQKTDYDGYDETEVYGIRDETDAEFTNRMASYRKRLTVYNEWHKENKDAIAAELQKREDDIRAEYKIRKAKEIAALEKKLKKLKNAKS